MSSFYAFPVITDFPMREVPCPYAPVMASEHDMISRCILSIVFAESISSFRTKGYVGGDPRWYEGYVSGDTRCYVNWLRVLIGIKFHSYFGFTSLRRRLRSYIYQLQCVATPIEAAPSCVQQGGHTR